MKKQYYMMFCLLAVCVSVLVGCAPKAPEETMVKLLYNGRMTEVKTSQWNENKMAVRTKDEALNDDEVYDYAGVRLSDLQKIAGAEDCTGVIVKGSDAYTAEVSAADVRTYEIALASEYEDGKRIPTGKGGPIKLIFPVSDHPELKDIYDQRCWVWYVEELEFVK